MLKHPGDGEEDKPRGKLRGLLTDHSPLRNLALGLIMLSLADLLTTYMLLRTGPHFYEANPVARWFFHRWNILGMTAFKFSLVGLIIVLCEVIERYRPGWGRLILILASGAAACVVARGVRLFLDGAG